MSLMKRFVDSLGIRDKLNTLPLPEGQSNPAYNAVHIIESVWTTASLFIHADWLRYELPLRRFDRLPSGARKPCHALNSHGSSSRRSSSLVVNSIIWCKHMLYLRIQSKFPLTTNMADWINLCRERIRQVCAHSVLLGDTSREIRPTKKYLRTRFSQQIVRGLPKPLA